MRSRLWFILISIAVLAVPAVAQKRNITEKDLFNFVWAGDTQISPDGSRVAFVRVTVNEKKDGYNTAIWSVSPATGETHQLTRKSFVIHYMPRGMNVSGKIVGPFNW